MNKIKLLNDEFIRVIDFDNSTNKKYPYYQNGGSWYAYCPYCHSIVNIKGGCVNKNQSNQRKMYASHHISEVNGFKLKDYKQCPFYKGNEGNWQGVYQIYTTIEENKELKTYIENNQDILAEELTELIGIAFKNKKGVNNLSRDIKESFIKNYGLHRNQWHPDMVSRIMLINSKPVKFWGYKVVSNIILGVIKKNNVFSDSLDEKNQFTPSFDKKISFVATMDNNESPKKIYIKLIWNNNQELILKNISAKIC